MSKHLGLGMQGLNLLSWTGIRTNELVAIGLSRRGEAGKAWLKQKEAAACRRVTCLCQVCDHVTLALDDPMAAGDKQAGVAHVLHKFLTDMDSHGEP